MPIGIYQCHCRLPLVLVVGRLAVAVVGRLVPVAAMAAAEATVLVVPRIVVEARPALELELEHRALMHIVDLADNNNSMVDTSDSHIEVHIVGRIQDSNAIKSYNSFKIPKTKQTK